MGVRIHVADAANVTAALVIVAGMRELLGDGETPAAGQVLVLTDHGCGERFVIVGDDAQLAALARGLHGQAAPSAATEPSQEGWTSEASYRFPDADTCRAVNEKARFLPITGPDKLPCLVVGGVLVFAYLDPETGAVRVSVDLDDAQPELARPDYTLPLRVEVSGAPVFDDSDQARAEGKVIAPTRR